MRQMASIVYHVAASNIDQNLLLRIMMSFSCFFTRNPYYLAILSDNISMISYVFIEPVLADSMFNT